MDVLSGRISRNEVLRIMRRVDDPTESEECHSRLKHRRVETLVIRL